MCRYMAARHLSCKHLHHWFARCFWAVFFEQECCQLDHFPIWEYNEAFKCPRCRDKDRMEAEALLERGREGEVVARGRMKSVKEEEV